MADQQAKIDRNRTRAAIAESDSTGETRPLLVDELTGRLKVDSTGTSTGTQYTEGDSVSGDATGTLSMGESPTNTIEPQQLDASGNLKVTIEADNAGIGGGTQYTEDDASVANPVGSMGMAVRADSLSAVTSTDGDNIALRSTNKGELYVKQSDTITVSGSVGLDAGTEVSLDGSYIDSFGHIITGEVNNQIDIQYYRGTPASLVNVTTSDGGTATSSGGMATYAVTTTTNSTSKGVTNESTKYTGGAEIYTIFTAGFTGSGSGTSYQRIGLFDDNNGFFIGYEGGDFGITHRDGGSDARVLKANFSNDDLTGGSTSLFTRGGTAEAIDLTKLNVFRIRFGWVGSAPVKFEVLAPDGEFVLFHVIKQPNLENTPSIQNADLPVTCHVNSGNSGQALTVISNCWVAGTTQSLTQMDSSITDKTYAQLTRSIITGETTAGGGGYVNVKVNPSGSLEVGGTVTANLSATDNAVLDSISASNSAIQTAVQLIDNAIAGSEMQVDVITSALPTGASTSANQSTIIGHVDGIEGLLTTIDADTSSLAGAVSGSEVQVDVVGSLPAGTNAIGKLSANDGVDIGDVSINNTVSIESDGTALGNGQVSVGTTAGGTTIASASAGRQGVIVTNQGSIDVYIGTGTVTTANGFLLRPNESVGIPSDSDIKGITGSSTTTVGYLSFG